MPDEKWIETIHKEIDGLNSPEESSKLKIYLAKHPEENQLYKDLLNLTTLMKTVETPDPSPALKINILKEIPYNMYPPREITHAVRIPGKIIEAIRSASLLRVNLRYAAAFAAGFVVSMILFFIYQNKVHPNLATDSTYMQGVMGLSEELASFEEADRAAIDLPALRGGIQIHYNKDIIQAKLELKSSEPVDVVLEFDEKDLTFDAIRLVNNPERSKMIVGINDVILTHEGNRNYWFIFNNNTTAAAPLTLKIFSAGSIVYEVNLMTGVKSNK